MSLIPVNSSQPDMETRLDYCEACGYPVRLIWSEYDAAFLLEMNISPKGCPCC